MIETEVAVLGAGIMGLSAAWRLALAGRHVVVLEQHAIGHGNGSSHGPTRVFRYAYEDPFYVELAQRALPLWRELDAGAGDLLVQTGGVDVGASAFVEPIAHALEARGAAVERLSPQERSARFPWLVAGADPAVYSPDTGVLVAERAVQRTAEAARAHGARIFEHQPVRAVAADSDSVLLSSDDDDVKARWLVVAAGAWAGSMLAGIGIDMPPLRVTREQVLYFGAAAAGELPASVFIHWGDIHRYGVPRAGSAPGYKAGEHGAGRETTAESRSFALDEPEAARLRAYVATSLPGLEPNELSFETCLYTNTPTHDFVIDARERIVVASPCSGHGFKFAPLVGEMVAAGIAGARFPDRFALSASP